MVEAIAGIPDSLLRESSPFDRFIPSFGESTPDFICSAWSTHMLTSAENSRLWSGQE
jgi:hypothetical protein